MNQKSTITVLQNLFFSEGKPAELRPVDVALLTYLILRQTEDHYIFDSQLTLANRLGCERKTIGDSIKRLAALEWILIKNPFQWSDKTKRKTRFAGATIGLSVNLAKLPQLDDRVKHSQPSAEAKLLAAQHTAMLIKAGLGKRRPKTFDRQQEHAAQRIIDQVGGEREAIEILNFALSDVRFQKAADKSLYELRSRLPAIMRAFGSLTA